MTQASSSKSSFWPYGIIGTFVVFIASLAIFVSFAVANDVELVAKDYYQQEIEYGAQMERLRRTQALAESPQIELSPNGQTVLVGLPAAHRTSEIKGSVQFYFPADVNGDHSAPLQLSVDGTQEFEINHLPTGRCRVKLRWTFEAEEYYHEETLLFTRNPTL